MVSTEDGESPGIKEQRQGRGKPKDNMEDDMDIYYQKDERNNYRWTWPGAHEVKVFGYANSMASVKRRAKRLFPSEEIEFNPFRTVEGEVVPLSATESTDQPDPDEL